MARFPYKPGAGAKAIRNPVYWNRLYLQETQGSGRGSRVGQYAEDAHLTARWLNINTNLNYFLCGWFKPVLDISESLTKSELRSVNSALEVVNEFRDTIGSSWDYMSQGNLNKFVTRIKRLILIIFRLTIKYDLFSKGEERLVSYAYDSDEKDFVLLYDTGRFDRIYFMGRPAVSQIAKIRQLYTQSVEAVAKEFGAKKPKQTKKVPKKSTKPKKPRKDSSSRPEAVVEEIDC
jgi:hypothetical protein